MNTKRISLSLAPLLCASAIVPLLPTFHPNPAYAQTAAAPKAEHDIDYFLRHGRNFVYAASEARKLIAAAPTSSHAHDLLACALAGRAASLAFAASNLDRFHQDQTRYASNLDQWNKAQQAPPAPPPAPTRATPRAAATPTPFVPINRLGFGTQPPQPPVLRTKDDGKVFTMSKEQAVAEFMTLGKEAIAEFAAAATNAANDKEKAEASATQSWGLLLLQRNAQLVGADLSIKADDILAGIRQATLLDATEATYWQGFGDITIRQNVIGKTPTPEIRDATIAAYRQTLTLTRHNAFSISMRVFYLLFPTDKPMENDRVPAVLDALQEVQRHKPDSPLPRYFQALVLVEQAANSASQPTLPKAQAEAVDMVEQANKMDFQLDSYQEAVPPHLSAAWNYLHDEQEYPSRQTSFLMRLAESLLPDTTKEPANSDRILRASRAMIAMSISAESHLSGDMSTWNIQDKLMEVYASASLSIGYQHLIAYYKAIGDESDGKIATAEFDSAHAAEINSIRQSQADDAIAYGKY